MLLIVGDLDKQGDFIVCAEGATAFVTAAGIPLNVVQWRPSTYRTLRDEIEQLRPTVILVCGNPALQAVTGESIPSVIALFESAGQVRPKPLRDGTIVPVVIGGPLTEQRRFELQIKRACLVARTLLDTPLDAPLTVEGLAVRAPLVSHVVESPALARVEQFLCDVLADGPRHLADVLLEGRARGFSRRTMTRARAHLKLTVTTLHVFPRQVLWSLPTKP